MDHKIMQYLINFAGHLLVVVCLAAATAAPLRAENGYSDVDRVVAIVNDDVIVQSELNDRYAQLVATLQATGASLPPQHVLERQVLDRLITGRLQLQEAERQGVTVDDETLARAINNIAKQNNITLSELRQAIESEGMSFSRFRDDMRREIITSRLRNQVVRNRIQVTDQEVEQFLSTDPDLAGKRTEYHLAHILIATPEGSSPDTLEAARDEATGLVEKLRGGADFGELALGYSDGQQALEGGDLGWLPAAQVPTVFVEKIVGMERGDISDPIRSASGYHIVKLIDYKGGDRHIITTES
jgi:peptidyl-prolyl cis-trans isomerase SurA